MTVVELLQAAKERVAEGWVKYSFATPYGVCALGALRTCGSTSYAYETARLWLHHALPSDFNCVAAWNDSWATTQADVLDLYDRAIRMAKDDPHG